MIVLRSGHGIFQSYAAVIVTCCLAAGCSSSDAGDRRPTAPASGVVTYLGSPLEGATVTFIPTTNPVPAYGMTDAEGRFQLSTYEQNDGAIIGPHVVTISKTSGVTPSTTPASTGNDDPEDFDNYVPPALGVTPPPDVEHLVPERYSRPEASGLTATITPSGPNAFTFDLVK